MDEEKHNILIPNSTQIPNVISDLIMPRISEAEMRCLNYICRRTYGFQKERDRISLSQFINGIKSRDGRRLDYGAGLSRPSVVEALRNLLGANLIKTIPTPKGNYYEINLELFRDKDNEEIEKIADEVVKKVNQLRKLTKSGKESKPKQVKLPNLQNKVLNKEKQSKEGEELRRLTPSQEMKLFIESEEYFNRTVEFFVEMGLPKEAVIRELKSFRSYWIELNGSGKKQKWEMQKTFELKRRIGTWFRNVDKFSGSKSKVKEFLI